MLTSKAMVEGRVYTLLRAFVLFDQCRPSMSDDDACLFDFGNNFVFAFPD